MELCCFSCGYVSTIRIEIYFAWYTVYEYQVPIHDRKMWTVDYLEGVLRNVVRLVYRDECLEVSERQTSIRLWYSYAVSKGCTVDDAVKWIVLPNVV